MDAIEMVEQLTTSVADMNAELTKKEPPGPWPEKDKS